MCTIVKVVEKEHRDCKIYRYSIERGKGRVNGDACIFLQRFKSLKHSFSGINKPQYRRWKKRGLTDGSLFACLDDFYPNGRWFPERKRYLRKNTGMKVLNYLLSDIKIHSPRIIYTIPTNDAMKLFLQSQGWISDYKNKKIMYLLF